MINEWSEHPSLSFVDGAPFSTLFQDTFKSRHGAFDEADQVFIQGCCLSERWRSTYQYSILELGFGLGVNFLATWRHWQVDPNRPARLHYLAIEKHPLRSVDLDRALSALDANQHLREQLVSQWPMLMAGLHRIIFDEGRVTLFLCIGDAQYWLRQLDARINSVYLDGFSPGNNPALWQESTFKGAARLCLPNASLASYSSAPAVRKALENAGFGVTIKNGFAGKHHRIVASLKTARGVAPHQSNFESPEGFEARDRSVIVIGAGLAGSAVSHALCQRGWRVSLIHDPNTSLLGSSQPICVEHLHASPDDNLLAQLTRSAWQLSRSGHWLGLNGSAGSVMNGKLMLLHDSIEYERWLRALPALRLPPEYLQLLDRATTLATTRWSPLTKSASLCGALWFADAACADPGLLCAKWQSSELTGRGPGGITKLAHRVERIQRADKQWLAFDAQQTLLANASAVVVCNAADAPRLFPIESIRSESSAGQSTMIRSKIGSPAAALGGAAYLCPIEADHFLVGSSFETAKSFSANEAGDEDNLRRLAQSLGLAEPELQELLVPSWVSRHAGARCTTRDRLPVIGKWPDEAAALADATRLLKNSKLPLPLIPNVYANFGYGARGLLWCVLGAELIAAMIHCEPQPLARDLHDAIAPDRSVRRWLRSF